jgi:hypothetical protein
LVVGAGALAAIDPSAAPLPGCPFHALTGLDCPGCGLTRGLHQLLRGHPLAALDHNVLLAVLVPVAIWAGLARTGASLPRPRPLHGRATMVVLGLLALFAILRNLPLPGAGWLAAGA